MKASAHQNNSLRIVGIFCLAVGVLVAVSLAVKFITLLTKSSFDGQHRFTIFQKGTPIQLYSFSPQTKTISLLSIGTQQDATQNISEKEIKIPIDAIVTSKIPESDSLTDYFQYLFFHYNAIQTDLTLIDIARLWLFAGSVDTADLTKETLSIQDIANTSVFDTKASKLFSDSILEKEDITIQVVNGTGIVGVGNEFSRILTNSGANVIAVTTARKSAPKTTIKYFGQPSYTLQKIEKILKKKAELTHKKGISDIIITLGKDMKGE